MSPVSIGLKVLLCGIVVAMVGCTAPGENPSEKRANVQAMKDTTLADPHQVKPETKEILKNSAGYAVFKDFMLGIIPGGASGYGVLVDNSTGKQTYMQMGGVTLGLLVMVKDTRMVIVFKDPATMAEFTKENWASGATAECAFNFGTFGGNKANATGAFSDKVNVYEFVENGVSLRAYLGLVKFSPYNQMNMPEMSNMPEMNK